MKKSILIGIIGLAASAATTFGQGSIALNNYSTSILPHALEDVTYGGPGAGGTIGAGINSSFTVGLYWVVGSQVGAFSADPTGIAVPTALFSGTGTLALGTGSGATGGFANAVDTGGALGEYAPGSAFVPEGAAGAGVTFTMEIIAYNGPSYANATVRGHSAAFTMVGSAGTAGPQLSGQQETDGGFGVFAVPEPSVLALSGIGAAAMMLFRRKKA